MLKNYKEAPLPRDKEGLNFLMNKAYEEGVKDSSKLKLNKEFMSLFQLAAEEAELEGITKTEAYIVSHLEALDHISDSGITTYYEMIKIIKQCTDAVREGQKHGKCY